MSPPISDLPPPPIEYHYTVDKYGSVIYIPPSDQDQFHELEECDQQLDFLEQVIQNREVLHLTRSLNKTRRRLFRENGLLKKRMAYLEHENQEIRHELDHIYKKLNIKKKRIHLTKEEKHADIEHSN